MKKPLSEELLVQVPPFGLFLCSYTLFSLLFSWFLSRFGLLPDKLTAKIFLGQFIFLSLHWFYYCLLFWPQKLVREKQKPKWKNSKILQKKQLKIYKKLDLLICNNNINSKFFQNTFKTFFNFL